MCYKNESLQIMESNSAARPTSLFFPHVFLRQMEQPSMDQKGHANVPWIVEPGQEAKRGVNTKYETTIF